MRRFSVVVPEISAEFYSLTPGAQQFGIVPTLPSCIHNPLNMRLSRRGSNPVYIRVRLRNNVYIEIAAAKRMSADRYRCNDIHRMQ